VLGYLAKFGSSALNGFDVRCGQTDL